MIEESLLSKSSSKYLLWAQNSYLMTCGSFLYPPQILLEQEETFNLDKKNL